MAFLTPAKKKIIQNMVFYSVLSVMLTAGLYLSYLHTFHALSWLLASVTTLVLAKFVYSKNKDSSLNKTFALNCILISLWTFDCFGFYIFEGKLFLKYWIRIFRPAYLFLAPTFFHFMLVLTKYLNKKTKKYLTVSYIIALAFSFLSFIGYFGDVLIKRNISYAPQMSFIYITSVINFIFWSFLGLYYVLKKYRKTGSFREKKQLQYFFLAGVIGVVLGAVPNTLYSLGLKVYPLGGISLALYVLIVSYAIVKHQLMDIRVIIRKSAIYASLTLSIVSIYAVVVGISSALFGKENISGISSWLINGFSGALIATLFLPLRNKIQNIIDKIFFKDKYNYRETLRALSNGLTSTLELDKLLNTMINKLTDAMHIDMACIFIYNKEKQKYYPKVSKGIAFGSFDISDKDETIKTLKREHSVLRIDNDKNAETEFLKRGFSIVCPFIKENRLLGVFALGPKKSDDMYTQEDIELLLTVSNQASIAVENARLNTEMRSVEKSLLESDKLAALGTLASSVAHEVRNPLASIKTFSQLMIKRHNDKEFIKKFNKIVPNEIVRMENVLSGLLDFNKFSEGEYEPVLITGILDDMVSLLDFEAFNKNINLIKDYSCEVSMINGSVNELKQVFMNLLINAMQAMPNGGEVKIEVSEDALNVIVTISDQGIGMTEEVKEKLFNPFFTTKPKGTGLGLSIIKKIIKGHLGNINAESIIGRGSKFIVFLPKNVKK